MLVKAKTGTGKTLAFLVAAAETVTEKYGGFGQERGERLLKFVFFFLIVQLLLHRRF
jgi:superfamily II DNA/RNA helicase